MAGTAMATTAEADVRAFEEQRPLLFGVAYRMLGSAVEAEDIVQDAYLRYQAVPRDEVRNERSYLVTIVSRLCLDHLKSARVQRERYVGPWLPEPVLTGEPDWRLAPDGLIDLRESVSMAFLVLLEALSPVERAVLLLHDVFDYSHAEIATILGRSEAASRQNLKRAHDRLAERKQRFLPAADEQRRLTLQFVSAAATGDLGALVELLAEDAIAYSDGGGKVAAALNPIYGADHVARFSTAFPRKEGADRMEFHEINGQPALATWLGHRLTNVVFVEVDGGRIRTVYVQRNPDKLRRLRQALVA
jgi:RNA polymerase sigma-70 factor (ECF subfamily)